MRRHILASLLLIPAAAQAQTAEPEQLPDRFVAAWNGHDIGAFEKLFTAEAIWVPSSEERTEGRTAILGEFAKVHGASGWAVTRKVTLAVKAVPKVQRLRPDVATIFFHMDFLSDGKLVPGQGRTLILVADKSASGWRIAAGQLTKEVSGR